MTSTDDTLTEWHEGCNEWGNLTIMGDALIFASHYGGQPVDDNTKEPTGLNEKQMEGLTADFAGDTKVTYSGDNDDSGSIRYLSIRYGGKVIGLANELNGLSLGAIGRETDIDHVEITNNVDLVVKGGKNLVPVTFINPLAANDALTSVDAAPADGFFTPANYRGGFGASNNWLAGWTAVSAYGMTSAGSSAVSNDMWKLAK